MRLPGGLSRAPGPTGPPAGGRRSWRSVLDAPFDPAIAETLLETLPDGVVLVDGEGAILFANRAAEQLFGYAPGALRGLGIEGVLSAVAPSEVPLAEGVSEMAVCRRDGSSHRVRVRRVEVETPGGPATMIVAQAAKPSPGEQRYRLLAEASQDQIFIIDRDGRVEYLNRCAAEQLGHPASAIVGRRMAEFFPPSFARRQAASLDQVFGEGKPIHREGPSRYGLREVWLDTWLVPLHDDDGVVTAVLGVSRDLTERRELEQQLTHAQKLEAVGRLTGGIAHDFNNLLTVIQGYVDMVLEQIDRDKPIWDDLREVQQAAARANALTQQLLAYGRRQRLDLSSVDLNAVIRDRLDLLRRLVPEDIEIRTAFGQVGPATADVAQLEQMLMNLVSNARDAMPAGGTITIETERVTELEGAGAGRGSGGPYACLRLRDTGLGMDAVTQTQIFQPFFTTKDVGKGTGLGLSGVYGTVKQLGGHVTVRSAPGEGATFALYFPEAIDHVAAAAPEPVAGAPEVGRASVLLVEDEDSVRQLVRTVLTRHGYRVTTASGPSEAVRKVDDMAPPALIICDIVLPEMSGPELVAVLRAEWRSTAVLYVSGYAHDVALERGLVDEASPVLAKPFTARALLERVSRLLG